MMTRISHVRRSLFAGLAAAAIALAGCAQKVPQGAGSVPANYAPYDPGTNPYCGALGTCKPLNNYFYPLRGSSGG